MGSKASKKQQSETLLDAQIAVLKANSKLSEQEIREMYEEFQQDVTSGNGRMNKQQFRKYYKQLGISEDKDGLLVDNTFALFDTNHDGSIDFSEFVLAVVVQNKTDLDGALLFSFALIDTSGDERISYDELVEYIEKAMILAVGKKEAATVDAKMVATDIYRQLGLDTTQKLTKQQFVDGCKKHSNLADIFGHFE